MVALPSPALQMRVYLLCALIVLLDGYDLQAMGLAVPTLARDWQLATPTFSYALSASLLGLGLGSAFIAPWGDRLGRRPLLLVLMGSGIGGVIMAFIALGAIFYPPAIRVTGFGWAGAVSRVGAVLGPLAGGWIIAAGIAPRMTLGLIAVPALLCIAGTLAMRHLPAFGPDIIPTTATPEIP
jgi:MFS family permease